MARVFRAGLRLLVAAIVAMASATPREARAGESVRLAYVRGDGAAECADEKGLRLGVAMRLGYDPFVAWAQKTVHADVAREGSRLRARVYLAGEDGRAQGTRVLFAPLDHCDKLLAAVALAVSIAIDPMSSGVPDSVPLRENKETKKVGETGRGPNLERDDAPSTTAMALPSTPSTTPSVDAQPIASDRGADVAGARGDAPSSPLHGALGIGSDLSTGTSPDLAVGVAASFRFESATASLAVEGRYQFPDSRAAEVGRGSVESSLVMVSLEPCWRLSPFCLCALATIGSLRGAGSGITTPQEQSNFYWGAGGRGAVEIPLSAPLSLRGHLDLVGNATRAILNIDDREVWRVSALYAAVGMDVATRIW